MTDDMFDIYAAGLFDGEGHVGVQANTYKRGRNCTTIMSITMTDSEALREFEKRYAGTFCIPNRKTPSGRQIYRWCASGTLAETFARRILPHVLVKGPQIEVLLRVRKTIGPAYAAPRITDTVWNKRIQLVKELKTIRAKGTFTDTLVSMDLEAKEGER